MNHETLPAQGPVDVNVRHGGCLLCAWGNDLPEGEHCRACGCGLPTRTATKDSKPKTVDLAEAVKRAQSGDAPIPFKGYA